MAAVIGEKLICHAREHLVTIKHSAGLKQDSSGMTFSPAVIEPYNLLQQNS
jgi:hypothetical protein